VREPAQTLRATVIGAGAPTRSRLSGSTVWNKYQGVPLRNVPVLHPRLRWREFRPGALSKAWQEAVKVHDLDGVGDVYALALPDDIPVTCQTVWQAALELQSFARAQLRQHTSAGGGDLAGLWARRWAWSCFAWCPGARC
jgi:ethanolamine utilization protein EutA